MCAWQISCGEFHAPYPMLHTTHRLVCVCSGHHMAHEPMCAWQMSYVGFPRTYHVYVYVVLASEPWHDEYIYLCLSIYFSINIHTYIPTYLPTYLPTYTHTQTHTQTHIHTQRDATCRPASTAERSQHPRSTGKHAARASRSEFESEFGSTRRN